MSNIIAQKREKIPYYELCFFMRNSLGNEFLDYKLPFPNYLLHTQQGHAIIMWCIEGFFGTKKNQEYLNDIIARFYLTFKEHSPSRFQITDISKEAHIDLKKLHSLKEFQWLKTVKKGSKVAQRSERVHNKDQVFFAIKFYAEELISQFGICSYPDLLDFAFSMFEHKEKSTLKSKCKAVFNWYEARDFDIVLPSKNKKYNNNEEKFKGTEMTRKENLIKVNKARAESKERLIKNTITGMFADTYKKKNGTWNFKKIATDLKISQPTVSKYLSSLED